MNTLQYRPEVDGLRALAVVPMIFFHAGLEGFEGGFVGLDLFFVISGYLITSIIISQVNEGRFTFTNFYERRARRLLPALYFLLAVCLPFAWFLLPAADLREFGSSLATVAVFGSNFYFWSSDIDYFASAAEFKPLLHTWSLGLEEQFYFVYPVFLVLTWRLGIKRVSGLLALIFLISLGTGVWGTQSGDFAIVSGSYYLLPTRGWQFIVGALIAFYLLRKPYWKLHGVNEFVSLLGLGMIIYGYVSFDKYTPYPSLYTLIPTIGTALIILSAVPRTIVNRLLSMKLIVGIGLISYSAYLWHQPILAFARYRVLGELPDSVLLILCALSLLVAWGSWKYVEAPFRNRQAFSRKSIFLISASGIVAFSVIGLVLSFSNGVSAYKNSAITDRLSQIGIENFEPDNGKLWRESWSVLRELSGDENYFIDSNPSDKRNKFDLSSNKTRVLLVGNSHSADVFNLFHFSEELAKRVDVARYGIQLRHINSEFYDSDPYKHAQVIMIVVGFYFPDLEILHELSSKILNDNKKLIIADQSFAFYPVGSNTAADYTIAKELQTATVRPHDLRRKVNAVYTNFYLQNSTPKDALEITQAYERVKARISVDLPQVVFLNRMDYICPDNLCYGITPDGRKTYYDRGHHTLAGAAFFAKQLPKTKFYRDFIAGLEKEE